MTDRDDALRQVAALISAALRNDPPSLEAELYPVAFRLGPDVSVEAVEKLLREVTAACRCGISPGAPAEVIPLACPVHGTPCDQCGGVEGCTDDCGTPPARIPDEGDWSEVGFMDDTAGEGIYADEHGGVVRLVFLLPEGQVTRHLDVVKQEEFAQLYVAACRQAEAAEAEQVAATAAGGGAE